MKKTGLFKIIMFVLLGIIVATWIFSASYFNTGEIADVGMYNIGFFDIFQLVFGAFEFTYFIQIFILLVSIGALYGVLGKTGKYRAWVERIANNQKGSELVFLIITAVLIAALTSVFDYSYILFIFFPLIISIILAMGYDKITAAVTTFGAMLVGTIGATISSNTATTINEILGVTEATSGIAFRIILLVAGLIALLYFLYKAKKVRHNDREEDDMFIGEKISNKLSVTSIIVVLSVVFVVMVLACTTWQSTFKVEAFSKLHATITEWSPKLPYFHISSDKVNYGTEEVAVLKKIFGTVSPFGEWRYAEMGMVCILASLLLGMLYRFKMSDTLSYMAEGAKKMLKPALMVMLTYSVIYFSGNTMFYPTIAAWILKITKGFNIITSSICMVIGSALHVGILYVANYVLPQIADKGASEIVNTLLSQGVYGVTMFIAPTSAVLVFGLTYLNIPYKEWIKRTWKLVLGLFAIVLLVTTIAMFI